MPVDESLAAYYGRPVGLIYLSEYRAKAECHGYKWAGEEPDQVCHVVSHSIKFQTPVQIKTPKMNQAPKWNIEREEEPLIRAELPDGPPVCHRLDEIDEPEGEPVGLDNSA